MKMLLDEIAVNRPEELRHVPDVVGIGVEDTTGDAARLGYRLDRIDTRRFRRPATDVEHKKAFVVDLDGTVYVGEKPIAPTVEFIINNMRRREFYFLTNNTSRTPEDCIRQLSVLGIDTDESHMISPHRALVDYLLRNDITRVCMVANKAFTKYVIKRVPFLKTIGSEGYCEAVVVAFDTELTYNKLKDACLCLQSPDVKLIATHRDRVCPTEAGPIPDAGSILALLEAATGRQPDYVFGKPDTGLLAPIRKRFQDDEIVIVGDRLYTDKALADRAGIDFILVLSGETGLSEVRRGASAPWLTVEDLGCL